jgi:hypothetical protein
MIRFQIKLQKEDSPSTNDILQEVFNGAPNRSVSRVERYIVLELDGEEKYGVLRMLVEDRIKFYIVAAKQYIIAAKQLGGQIYSDLQSMTLKRYEDSHYFHENMAWGHPELRNKLMRIGLAKTASAAAIDAMHSLFWELEIEPSWYSLEETWLHKWAPNSLKHQHDMITRSKLAQIQRIMEL